jgi:hypothetical protein
MSGKLPASLTTWRARKYVIEERSGGTMKTLSDVAASYDEWAETNEATAEEILAGLDSCAVDIRENQRCHASLLSAEAVELRDRAAEFRNIERRLSSLGLTVAHDSEVTVV